jgi:hypothetical protein
MTAKILRSAHGTGADALLRAEAPPLDEVPPLNAADTARGIALSAASGRPFTKGNTAAKNRGPSLTRTGVDLNPPDNVRRGVQRRAESLRRVRVRELRIAHGGSPLSSAVKAEVASWALAVAWSRFHYDQGDAKQGARFAELASAHQLRAIGVAEREGVARPAEHDDVPPGFERVPDGDE